MIYWCKKCKTPVFDKGLHSCSCDGKMKKISESSICNPVFKQERKLLEKIMECKLINPLEDTILGGVAPWKAESQGCVLNL